MESKMRKSDCKFYVTPDLRTICVYYSPFGTIKGIAQLAENDTYDKQKGEDIAFMKCKIKETRKYYNLRKRIVTEIRDEYIRQIRKMEELDVKLDKYWDKLDELCK